MRAAAALALLILVGPGRALGDTFTFRWPVPATVTVTEHVVKGDSPATLRYQVSIAPARDGRRLAVRLSRFEFLEVAGRDARAPKVRRQLAPALRAAAMVPTLLVSREGRVEDLDDLPAMIDRFVAGPDVPAAKRREVARMLKTPQAIAGIKEKSVAFWNVWVGMWAGATLTPGKSVELTQPSSGAPGVELPVRVTHHGPDGPPGYVHLSFESRLRGDRHERAMQGLLDGILAEMSRAAGRPLPREALEAYEQVVSGEVVTDPATLRPAAARMHQRSTLQLKGQPPQSDVETREYVFDWDGPPAPSR